MKPYIKELRKNRDLKANEILKMDLIDKFNLRDGLLRELSLIQNKARGNIFEIMGEVIVGNTFNIDKFSTQTVFDTPYGKRRVDLYDEKNGIIIEIKSGYARSKSFIRKQIKKDSYILNNHKNINRAIWICFRGATSPLQLFLNKYNIEYFDIEYDKIDNSTLIPKTVIKV